MIRVSGSKRSFRTRAFTISKAWPERTEELWFVNWEFKGMPWENRVNYYRWSPNQVCKKFDTPTLVIAGELDFRVPTIRVFSYSRHFNFAAYRRN